MYHLLFAGSGLIGCGLAANALSHHQDVTLYDIRDAEKVKDNLKDVLNKLVVAGVIEEEEKSHQHQPCFLQSYKKICPIQNIS